MNKVINNFLHNKLFQILKQQTLSYSASESSEFRSIPSGWFWIWNIYDVSVKVVAELYRLTLLRSVFSGYKVAHSCDYVVDQRSVLHQFEWPQDIEATCPLIKKSNRRSKKEVMVHFTSESQTLYTVTFTKFYWLQCHPYLMGGELSFTFWRRRISKNRWTYSKNHHIILLECSTKEVIYRHS